MYIQITPLLKLIEPHIMWCGITVNSVLALSAVDPAFDS